ncbi:hypothetical protein [Streptomyces pactum]|uniref:hypothetical protein n=1 Tax=Streptomyces pactum TaxID=68249 RepID=UPI0006E1C319|nr:hypothetical protein [Streptomyces pactum]
MDVVGVQEGVEDLPFGLVEFDGTGNVVRAVLSAPAQLLDRVESVEIVDGHRERRLAWAVLGADGQEAPGACREAGVQEALAAQGMVRTLCDAADVVQWCAGQVEGQQGSYDRAGRGGGRLL